MSFWDKLKDIVGADDEYYDDDFYDEYLELDEPENDDSDELKSDYKKEIKTDKKEFHKNKSDENVIKLRGSNNMQMNVTIRKPLAYEDGKIILDDILNSKTVVLNLESLEVDVKTQIFYFVSGGVYSLSGTIQNVTRDIYVLAPEGVSITGELKEQLANQKLYSL